MKEFSVGSTKLIFACTCSQQDLTPTASTSLAADELVLDQMPVKMASWHIGLATWTAECAFFIRNGHLNQHPSFTPFALGWKPR